MVMGDDVFMRGPRNDWFGSSLVDPFAYFLYTILNANASVKPALARIGRPQVTPRLQRTDR